MSRTPGREQTGRSLRSLVNTANEGDGVVFRNGEYINTSIYGASSTHFSGAMIYKSVDQTGINTQATVTFDTVAFDTDSYFDDANDKFIIPFDGYYRFTANVGVDNVSSGQSVWLAPTFTTSESVPLNFRWDRQTTSASTPTQYGGSVDLYLAADDEIYLTITTTSDTSFDVRDDGTYMSIVRLDTETALRASWSPILDHKPTTDTPDDEFDSTTLDGKWTAVSGSSGTVSLTETSNVTKYDLTTRPGWLLVQAGRGGTQDVELRQDYTLSDGDSIVLSCAVPMPMDAEGADNSDFEVGVALNDNDTGPEAGNFARILVAANTGVVGVSVYDGTEVFRSYTNTSPTGTSNDQRFYLRLIRSGTNYYPFFSRDGAAWSPLGDGLAVGATLSNVWIYARNNTSYSDAFIPIAAVDWIRQGTNALDPWPHSGLVTTESLGTAIDYPDAGWSTDDAVWGAGKVNEFTEVTVTGSQTITERNNVLSIDFTGQSTQDYNCLLKSHTFSVGDSFAVPIRIWPGDSSVLASAGVVFTDGTGTSANAVAAHIQQHDDETDTRIYTRHGTLTAMSSVSSRYTMKGLAIPWIWLRLTYQASNTWRKEISVDGISWSTGGISDVSKTMTPTHFGLAWSIDASTGNGFATFGPIQKLA